MRKPEGVSNIQRTDAFAYTRPSAFLFLPIPSPAMERRSFLKAGLSAGALLASRARAASAHDPPADSPIKHSASKWCYPDRHVRL